MYSLFWGYIVLAENKLLKYFNLFPPGACYAYCSKPSSGSLPLWAAKIEIKQG